MENMDQQNEHLFCHICKKKFSSVSTKNRHLKNVHHEEPLHGRNTQHIKCPLCVEEEKTSFGSHDLLINHLEQIHSLNIKQSLLNFRNKDEFEAWRALDNRNVDYAHQSISKKANNEEYSYYNCNRSNSKGYVSQCSQRSSKIGGSIKISGLCPSRICVKITSSGVTVKYIETHVGHEDELRSKRLTKSEQEMLASKLMAGVTKERILEDVKILKDHKLDRINILTRGDLAYIIRKFNIDKRRDADDLTATALKVQELNSQGENIVFLFKQIGESYPGLETEDFALGFMTKNMERKLKDFKRIICIDGTHGTNARNWDLTTVLIKDENNIGFPVAFLISNRLDQTIQTIFFRAMKQRIGEAIEAEFIMTDDDVKYFNAWCQVMVSNEKPRRLLCTWHVIKNWNIQGRNKLKNKNNKMEMKNKMRKILKETDCGTFEILKENYFKQLEEDGENEFLKYLRTYYFQSLERIMMWAHCHRRNVGINTNMAIESLNKVIKYNKMKGRQNIRIEKLLDILEELANDKMWKKIVDSERPNANSYHSRVNREAHMKAEKILEKVVSLDSGEFKVFSSSVSEQFYMVSYNEICDNECRTLYCDKCKVCIHKFKCDCSEYSVKTALCKHIHAVALIEKRSEYVTGAESDDEDNQLRISEPSTSRVRYQTEVNQFIEEIEKGQIDSVLIDPRVKSEIIWEQMGMKFKSLDEDSQQKMLDIFNKGYDGLKLNKSPKGTKRRIEKQLYFPNKK